MNCREAEQLIPFFVEADLDAAAMQQVTKHVELCDSCRALVAEFQASQLSLRAMALPAFDEAMLATMRTAVRCEMAQMNSRPSIADWLSPLWNWKVGFAAAAVILLASGILLSRRDAGTKNVQVANKTSDSASSVLNVLPKEATQKTPIAQNIFQPRMGRKNKAQGGVSVSERNPENSATNSPSPARATGVEAPLQPEDATAVAAAQETEPEMLRIELQTADPNIRIIWLMPQETGRTNPVPLTENTK